MQEKTHPTQRRNMYKQVALCLSLSVLPFCAAFYVANPHDDRLETAFSVLFMMLLLLAGLSVCWFQYFSHCPHCHKRLKRDKLNAKAQDTITFSCKSCQVIWDSRLKMDP